MECDLLRLQMAIEAASERLRQDRRFEIMLAGGEPEDDVDVPDESDSDEVFNANLSGWLASAKGRFSDWS